MSTSQMPQHNRVYQACNPCREKRVRCHLGSPDAPHNPPCARCRRENRECTFSTFRKRNKRVRLDNSQPLHERTQSSLPETSPPVTRSDKYNDETAYSPIAKTDNKISSNASEHRSSISSPSVEQTLSALLKGPAYTTNDTLSLLHEAGGESDQDRSKVFGATLHSTRTSGKDNGSHPTTISGSTYSLPRPRTKEIDVALDAWSNLRFVRSGLFSAEEALAYIDYFYTFLLPFSPILSSDFKHPSQHSRLLEEEPILTITMLMVASRFMKLNGPGAVSRSYVIHDRLWKYLQSMISRVFWSEEQFIDRVGAANRFSESMACRRTDTGSFMGSSHSIFRSLGTCEALLLLLEWHPRALHFPPWDEDTASIIVKDAGNARGSDTITTRYGRLRSGIDWLERSERMSWSLLGTASSIAADLGVFDEPDSMIARVYNGLNDDRSPLLDQRVRRIQQLIWVYSIQISGRLGWKYFAPLPITEQCLITDDETSHCWVGIATLLKKANEMLFVSQKHTNHIVKSGEYVRLLQALQPLLQDWEKNFDHAKLSKPMRSILGIEFEYLRVYIYSLALQAIIERRALGTSVSQIDLPNAPEPESIDGGYLRQIIAAARKLLQIVVYEIFPADNLKYIPVRTYSRILAGSLCLLKTCAINISGHEVDISLGIVDKAAKALRNSVVDDLNLSTRWGELLQTLSSNLRTQLEQMSKNQSGSGKDVMPYQETPEVQSSNQNQILLEGHTSQSFRPSQQPSNLVPGNLANLDMYNTSGNFDFGSSQSNLGINNLDDLSLWLDPSGDISAGLISQMPWHADQGMYGMLEPFMGGSGDYYDTHT